MIQAQDILTQYSGAYLSVLSAFNQPPGRIRASVAAYPFLDFADPWYHQAFEKRILDQPQLPAEIVTAHLGSMKPGAIVTSATPPERRPLMMAAAQQGKFVEFLGDDIKLYPMRMLEEGVKTPADLPKIFIYHGRQDSAVPYQGTEKFEKTLKGLEGGKEKIYISIQEGEHGFDCLNELTLDTPWLKEGLEFVTATWLE